MNDIIRERRAREIVRLATAFLVGGILCGAADFVFTFAVFVIAILVACFVAPPARTSKYYRRSL